MRSKIFFICIVINFTWTYSQIYSGGDTTISFSIDELSENIQKELKGHCMGFGFVIYEKGVIKKTISYGYKRKKIDGGEQSFDDVSKMQIASMSKTLSAICTLRLMAHDKINTYEEIKDYLPSDWKLGPNVNKITFRRLLRHESGIRVTKNAKTNGETYDELKGKIKEGVIEDSIDVYQYQNMNFALLRILIPRLDGYKLPKNDKDEFTANKYINYVKQHIFETCELKDVNTFPSEKAPVHNYVWPYKGGHGQLFYDYTLTCGAYGWYLSVADYGKIINKLFNSDDLLNAAWRDTMTTNSLGCYTYGGKYGGYFWHNGEWICSDNNGSGNANTCWMYFPNNIIVVALVNSDIPAWFPDILAQAYDKAWSKKN